ncbi:MAG: hypothetical protein JWN41_1406 [Thermoleophilia bacterium]|nr:hypothetical protein [Thermoleophilia bacterium]
MSAPLAYPQLLSHRRLARVALPLVLAAAVFVSGGCDTPRAFSHKPAGLPASIDYLPGDSMGWVVFDTDPASARWRPIDRAVDAKVGARTVDVFASRLLGSSVDVARDIEPWVGSTGGYALVTSDIASPDATIGFFDVAHRDALERVLRAHDYHAVSSGELGSGPGGDLALWKPRSSRSDAASSNRGILPVIGVADHALVYGRTVDALRSILHRTDQLSASERRGTNRFTVKARATTPIALVYRGDDVRDQLLRLVRSDPSTLEVGRWFAATSVVSASRDGWVGVAPPLDRSRRAVRLIGGFEWAKGQSTIGEPKPVRRAVVDALPGATRAALAVTDAGAYLTDFVGAATDHGYQFATKQDVPKGQPHVQALKLLAQFDGETTFALGATGSVTARAHVKSARSAVAQVKAAARLVAIDDRLIARASGKRQVEVSYEPPPSARHMPATAQAGDAPHVPRSAAADAVNGSVTLGTNSRYRAAMRAVGAPPRVPVAWVYVARSCAANQGIAAWLTWDRDKNMAWSTDIPLVPTGSASRCDALLQAGKLLAGRVIGTR